MDNPNGDVKKQKVEETKEENNADNEENEIENEDNDIRTNPMKNPLIVDHVFTFLGVKDIRVCRLVCSKWNILGHTALEKKSVIKIACPQSGFQSKFSPTAFKQFASDFGFTFQKFQLGRFPHHMAKWPRTKLIEFLDDQKENMKHLMINNIRVRRSEDNISTFNISPYITNQLTNLTIDNNNGTVFVVSTEKLTSTKYLSFKKSEIDIAKNCKLAPRKLEMQKVAFMKNGRRRHNLKINEILDFKNLTDLQLEGKNITIYMGGKIELDNLSLNNVKADEFETSTWEVKEKLLLRGIPITNSLFIKFTDLNFGNATIRLNVLPNWIERLTISKLGNRRSGETKILSIPEFTLPKLKYLELICENRHTRIEPTNVDEIPFPDEERDLNCIYFINPFTSLSMFTNYPNITTLKLVCKDIRNCYPEEAEYLPLETQWIPRSVKTIILSGRIEGSEFPYHVNKLIVEDNHKFNTKYNAGMLNTNHLVVCLDSRIWDASLEHLLSHLIKHSYETVAFGPLQITAEVYRTSSVFKYVNKYGKYYFFQNQIGRALTESQFNKMAERY